MPRRAARPANSRRVTRRTPIDSDSGGTQIETVTTTRGRRQRRTERREPISSGGSQTTVETSDTGQEGSRSRGLGRSALPTSVGSKAAGVGLLEAEFLIALLLIILFLFADTSKTYSDKIMSTMKRGTMISLLFFVLALTAGVGPNAARIAKAIGGLTIVAIFLTSPMTDIIGNLDKFFKADWAGTAEHGTDIGSTSSTSDTGSATGGGSSGALHAAEGAASRITQIIESFGFGIIK